jgi:hypothetical protein
MVLSYQQVAEQARDLANEKLTVVTEWRETGQSAPTACCETRLRCRAKGFSAAC